MFADLENEAKTSYVLNSQSLNFSSSYFLCTNLDHLKFKNLKVVIFQCFLSNQVYYVYLQLIVNALLILKIFFSFFV